VTCLDRTVEPLLTSDVGRGSITKLVAEDHADGGDLERKVLPESEVTAGVSVGNCCTSGRRS
jgi:hypothetical protein